MGYNLSAWYMGGFSLVVCASRHNIREALAEKEHGAPVETHLWQSPRPSCLTHFNLRFLHSSLQ